MQSFSAPLPTPLTDIPITDSCYWLPKGAKARCITDSRTIYYNEVPKNKSWYVYLTFL